MLSEQEKLNEEAARLMGWPADGQWRDTWNPCANLEQAFEVQSLCKTREQRLRFIDHLSLATAAKGEDWIFLLTSAGPEARVRAAVNALQQTPPAV